MSGEGGDGGQEIAGRESSSESNEGMQELLDNFREQWQRELEPPASVQETKEQQDDPLETQARLLFLRGVSLEEQGRLHEAISCYRRALQLVPDIEGRIFSQQQQQQQTSTRQHSPPPSQVGQTRSAGKVEESSQDNVDLREHFQWLLAQQGAVCQRETNTKAPHISALPPELLLLLLRWVVSEDLDLRSLENCSQVCRGFYLAARDNEIWRLVCARVWGPCSVVSSPCSWRDIFISRPRLQFHGCYISRTSYIRAGEHNFQDSCYHLWHSVQYFRYLRFFPGGLVLMLTTSEEPTLGVSHLRSRSPRNPAVLAGCYELAGDRVAVTVRAPPSNNNNNNNAARYRGRRRNVEQLHDSGEKTFHVELQISLQRKSQLSWLSYCIETKYKAAPSSVCPFELCPSKFPSLWFSRVKSYVATAEACL